MRAGWDIVPGREPKRIRRVSGAMVAVGVAALAVALLAGGGPAPVPVAAPGAPTAAASADAQDAAGPAPVLAAEEPVARVPAASAAAATAGSTPGAGPVRRPAPSAEPSPPTPPGQPPKSDDIPGEWIVSLRAGEDPQSVAASHDADVSQVYDAGFDGFAASMSEADAQAAASDPRVATIVRDRRVYALADGPTGIPRANALGIGTAVPDVVNVDVAIVDTGIATHSNLNRREGKNCISSGRAANDGDGHGTHVAGTVGAKGDGGVVGVAPGARVWAVKVLDDNGSGTWSQVACGLNWVAQNAGTIEVANLSLGGSGSDGSCGSSALHQASCAAVNAGVTVVVAAGNSSANASKHVPAAFDEVITVSALADFDGRAGGGANDTCRTDEDDTLADFSNYGADVDIIAPGVCILSTWKGGGTRTLSGTSMASPHVAGAAAVFLAANPGIAPSNRPGAVRTALRTNGNSGWTGDKSDGEKEPLLDLSFLGGTGLSAIEPGDAGTIEATGVAGTYDSGTKTKTKLTWSGIEGSSVDIWRNNVDGGVLAYIQTTDNDGIHNDKFGTKLPSTTRTYKICAAGSTTICSAEFTVSFP